MLAAKEQAFIDLHTQHSARVYRKEFADKGIPVDLRPQLVGDGLAAG